LLKEKEDQLKQKNQSTKKSLPLSTRDISSLHQENPFQAPISLSNPLYRTSQEQYNLDDLD